MSNHSLQCGAHHPESSLGYNNPSTLVNLINICRHKEVVLSLRQILQRVAFNMLMFRIGCVVMFCFPANAFLVTSVARERNESDWSDLQIVITPRIPLEDETPIWVGLPIILNRIDSVGELRFNAVAYQQPTWDDSDLAIVDYKMYSSAPIDMEKHLEGLKIGKVLKKFSSVFGKIP